MYVFFDSEQNKDCLLQNYCTVIGLFISLAFILIRHIYVIFYICLSSRPLSH